MAHSLCRSEKHASRHRAFWFVTNSVQYQLALVLVWFVYVVVVVVGLVVLVSGREKQIPTNAFY